MKNRLTRVEYINFSKVSFLDTEFGDLQHLKGVKKFSMWFADLLKNGLLTKADIQSYVNKAIRERTDNSKNK